MILWCIYGLLILGIGARGNEVQFCDETDADYPNARCYNKGCMTAIVDHIEHEFTAAFKYLYMGALFGQYEVERPGMANFFLDSASEERGHAIQMMDYLNMRGVMYTKEYNFGNEMLWKINDKHITGNDLKDVTIKSALKEALDMEIGVTKKINEVVKQCNDDFHAADVFTNPILEEQHTGIRKLQGAIKTIEELERGQSGYGLQFAEYVFDQKMVKGEIP